METLINQRQKFVRDTREVLNKVVTDPYFMGPVWNAVNNDELSGEGTVKKVGETLGRNVRWEGFDDVEVWYIEPGNMYALTLASIDGHLLVTTLADIRSALEYQEENESRADKLDELRDELQEKVLEALDIINEMNDVVNDAEFNHVNSWARTDVDSVYDMLNRSYDKSDHIVSNFVDALADESYHIEQELS